MDNFTNFPDHTRLWVFQSAAILDAAQIVFIEKVLNTFLDGWKAHGKTLKGAFEIKYNHFIVIAVNEEIEAASGCSIDSLTAEIRKIETALQISLLDRMLVFYTEENTIKSVKLPKFKEMIKQGLLSPKTTFFDSTVATVGAYKNNWETTIENSWAKNLLG